MIEINQTITFGRYQDFLPKIELKSPKVSDNKFFFFFVKSNNI